MAVKIMQLIDQQTFQGQAIENVFHFVDEDGVADMNAFPAIYVADVLPLITPAQQVGCVHVNIRYRQVYPTATLFLDHPISPTVAGGDPGDPEPSSVAASVKWLLGNPTVVLAGGFTGHIKRGGARIGGVSNSFSSGNTIAPEHVPLYAAWAAELRSPGSDTWQLCVASYLLGNPVAPVPPATHAVPRDRSETVTAYTIVTGASAPAPSTQNTRKFLRGIAS
jgi:hypothetical protein